jgi:hypothetical protein
VETSPQIGVTEDANLARAVQGIKEGLELNPIVTPPAAGVSLGYSGDETEQQNSLIDDADSDNNVKERIFGEAYYMGPLGPFLVNCSARQERYLTRAEKRKLSQDTIRFYAESHEAFIDLPGPSRTMQGENREEFIDYIRMLAHQLSLQQRGRRPYMKDLVNTVIDYGRPGGWWQWRLDRQLFHDVELPAPKQRVSPLRIQPDWLRDDE